MGEPPEFLVDLLEQAPDVAFARDVGLDDERPAPRLFDLDGDFFGRGNVARVIDRDAIALNRRHSRHRRADAAARAGDQEDFFVHGLSVSDKTGFAIAPTLSSRKAAVIAAL